MNKKLVFVISLIQVLIQVTPLFSHQWPWPEKSLASRFGVYHADVFNKGLLFHKKAEMQIEADPDSLVFTDGSGLFPASVSGFSVYSEEDSFYTFYQNRPDNNLFMVYDRLNHCFLNPFFYISEFISSKTKPQSGHFLLESPGGIYPLNELPVDFGSGTYRLLLLKDELDFFRIIIFLNGENVLQLSFEAVEEINGTLYLKGDPAVSVTELSKGAYYNLGLIHLNPGMNDLEIIRQDFTGRTHSSSEMINLKKPPE